MNKKHFIALADALRATNPGTEQTISSNQWYRDVCAIAAVCKQANGAFKTERWLAYINGECGPNGGKLK